MTYRRIDEWFSDTARDHESDTAIASATGSVSYAELEARSNSLANFLIASGAAGGSLVAILSEDRVETVVAMLATLKAGCVFIPIETRTPERRLAAMLAEVPAAWFISDPRFASLIDAAVVDMPTKPKVVPAGTAPLEADQSASVEWLTAYRAYWNPVRPHVPRAPDDISYVYFTSGSTGRPKGMAGRLKAIDHFIRWEIGTFSLGLSTRVSQLITPSFDAFLRDVFTPLCAGGTICLPDSPEMRFDARRLVEWLDASRVTLVHCVPSLFRSLLDEGLTAGHFAALRQVLLSGETLLPIDVRRWMDVFGDRIQLVNLYGPSETTMVKFFHPVKREDLDRRSIPIGRPMIGATAAVLDRRGQPCAKGVAGEIHIRTPYRTLGYYGRDDLTREVFIQNPFSTTPDDLIYKTGDLGRILEDGTFELLGRRDHQVKIRGERVELGAIENVLRAHADVSDTVVIDVTAESGTKYLCAYVVLRANRGTSGLREYLAQELPPVMVPSAFVAVDALPRTPSGKVDRQGLPAPDPTHARMADAPFEPARNPVEAQLTGIFAQVLGVGTVGIRDNFFELGGHSLLATQLVSRVRRTLGVELPLRYVFDSPTAAGIAKHVDTLRWAVAGGTALTDDEVELHI